MGLKANDLLYPLPDNSPVFLRGFSLGYALESDRGVQMRRGPIVCAVIGLVLVAQPVNAQPKDQSPREDMYRRYLEFPSYVKGGAIDPHWMADGSSFWYVEGAPENTIIYKVDPKANTKTPLFDTARLRQALAGVLGSEPPYK